MTALYAHLAKEDVANAMASLNRKNKVVQSTAAA
jgi:hypothetical protein